MSLTFITVNAKTNQVVFAGGYSVPFFPNPDLFTTFADDTDSGIKDLINNVNSHTFDQIMTGKPYISVYYDGTNVIGTLVNPPSTVSTQATVSVLGQTCQVDIVNNQFTFPVTLHLAVAIVRVTLSVKVEGFPFTTIEIGGSNGNIEATIYQDSSGVYKIVPAKASDLAAYWQNSMVDMSYSNVDLATADGIAIHTLFHYVLPALNLTLTASEQAGLTEIQNNLLPSLATNLSNITDGTNFDIHYNSYKLHTQQAKSAMDKYVADRIEISKYTTLK
jgi:hypothetical protein